MTSLLVTSGITQYRKYHPLNPGLLHANGQVHQKNNVSSGTFAPEFVKTEELRRGADQIRGQEGDNDFSGNKYVWLKDPEKAFIRGLVVEEQNDGALLVQSDDGDVIPIES